MSLDHHTNADWQRGVGGRARWAARTPFVPDLYIEIQSPEQSEKMLIEKATHFLANGGRMVWIIYPDKGIVEWLTPSERRLLVGDDVIVGGEVLPGFAMTVEALLTVG